MNVGTAWLRPGKGLLLCPGRQGLGWEWAHHLSNRSAFAPSPLVSLTQGLKHPALGPRESVHLRALRNLLVLNGGPPEAAPPWLCPLQSTHRLMGHPGLPYDARKEYRRWPSGRLAPWGCAVPLSEKPRGETQPVWTCRPSMPCALQAPCGSSRQVQLPEQHSPWRMGHLQGPRVTESQDCPWALRVLGSGGQHSPSTQA